MTRICIRSPRLICWDVQIPDLSQPPNPNPPDPPWDIKGVGPEVLREFAALARIHAECKHLGGDLASQMKRSVEAGVAALSKQLPDGMEISIGESGQR